MLGNPWHVECQPTVKYKTEKLRIGKTALTFSMGAFRAVGVHKLGAKRFRSLLRNKKKALEDFCAHQIRIIN